ncbi:GatB/YqeY domain-containing protein [Atopobiaceae bacterium 24-176]
MDKSQLLNEIKDAMRAKDKNRLSILRQVNQAMKQIEVDERRDVTEADLVAAVKKLQKVTAEEEEAIERVGAAGHEERLAMLREQAEVLKGLLPAQLEGDELKARIDAIIAEEGLATKRDMGKVMGALTRETQGNFDKPAAASYAGSRLS